MKKRKSNSKTIGRKARTGNVGPRHLLIYTILLVMVLLYWWYNHQAAESPNNSEQSIVDNESPKTTFQLEVKTKPVDENEDNSRDAERQAAER